jgi:glutamyl-tRNA synthetase
MEVSTVVRGADLLPSTARQILLYRALSLVVPRFGHVPLVVGEDGERLAKRHGALSLGELRDRGASPRAVVGLLARSTGLAGPREDPAPSDLVRGFSLDRVGTEASVLRGSDVAALLG